MELTAVKLTLDNIDRSNWKTYRFDQIAKNISERVEPTQTNLEIYVGLDHIDSDSIHIKRFGKREDVSGTKLRCYPGDVIFGRRRAYQRKAAIVTFDGFCSAHSLVLRANHDVILPELFPFFLHSDTFMHLAVDISVGSLSPTINWGDLKKQEFLLPPRDQQQQITELLWAGDEMIESQINLLISVERNLKICSTEYMGHDNLNNGNPLRKEVVKLKQVAKVQAGATPLRANRDFFDEGTISWVKTLDLNNNEILSTEENITEYAVSKTSCKVRPVDTVLVAMYGGFNQIGRTGILKIPAATNQAVSAITVNRELVLPEFLLYYLNTNIRYWKKVAISSRKDPNITKVDIENFPFALYNIEDQNNIVATIKQFINSRKSVLERIKDSQSLQKSLINQFF